MKKYRWYAQKTWKALSLLIIITIILTTFLTVSNYDKKESALAVKKETREVYWDVPLDDELQDYIKGLCDKKDIPPQIIIGIIEVESGYNQNAKGDGCQSLGLMQIQGKWLKNPGNLLDPYNNVKIGIKIYSKKLKKYKTLEKALIAYNLGDYGAEQMYFKNGIYSNRYSKKVLKVADNLKEI